MAVLQRLSLPNIDWILGILLDQDIALVSFRNQVKGESTIPDAKIETGSSIWIETKRVRNAVSPDQIQNHLENLREGESLLLLTPDDARPRNIPDSVVWVNFNNLAEAIEAILVNDDPPPTESERFLLRELRLMLEEEGLLDKPVNRVLVRPARMAWPMYNYMGVYTCKPNEMLRSCSHLAFYTKNAIQPLVPKIITIIPSIAIADMQQVDLLVGSERELAQAFYAKFELGHMDDIKENYRIELTQQKTVVFLSAPDDPDTIRLAEGGVSNNKVSQAGARVAWMMGNSRYVTLDSLEKAKTTSNLISA